MTCFHHVTTFQVLSPLVILKHACKQDFFFTSTTGRERAHSCPNYSLHTDLPYFQAQLFSHRLSTVSFEFTQNLG
jgi:hypothetical protein